MPLTILAFISVLLLFIAAKVFSYTQNAAKAKAEGLGLPQHPQAPAWDVLGLKFLAGLSGAGLNNEMHKYLDQTFKKLGQQAGTTIRTFVFSRLGAPTVVTLDPVNTNAILVTQFNDFSMGNRAKLLGPLIGVHSIILVDGEKWSKARPAARDTFRRDRVSDLTVIDKYTTQVLDSILLRGQNGTHAVDLQDLFAGQAMSTSLAFLGVTEGLPSSLDSQDAELVHAFEATHSVLIQRVMLGDLYFLCDGFSFRRSCSVMHRIVDRNIDRVLADMKASRDEKDSSKLTYLEELALEGYNREYLRSAILGMLVAGRDNTATLLTWLFFYLAKDVQSFYKLRNTILSDFGTATEGREITFDNLKNCIFLQNCIKESLRLHAPVPLAMKEAVRDTTLPRGGGADGTRPIFVAKGTEIVYHFHLMHRDREYWGEDADVWRPERWETGRPGKEYAPFNAGPRLCVGMQFATTSAAYTIVRIMQDYDRVEDCNEPGESKIATGLAGLRVGGMHLKLYPAKK